MSLAWGWAPLASPPGAGPEPGLLGPLPRLLARIALEQLVRLEVLVLVPELALSVAPQRVPSFWAWRPLQPALAQVWLPQQDLLLVLLRELLLR